LLDVLPQVLKSRKDAKLLLVGDGPLRKDLCEYADKKGIADNAIFAGKRPDLVNMLCAMDVFTLPSIYEGSPVSAVEAAANGLPVVLSSSITKDLKFLRNVAYVDIDKNSCNKWAETIIELSEKEREQDAVTIINNNGFNIRAISKLLEKKYLEKVSGK
jgi:glycosyltransferase involved in cell wall biosynthesis